MIIDGFQSNAADIAKSIRYLAPELLFDDVNHGTTQGDIWAFMCVLVEVTCLQTQPGKLPYSDCLTQPSIYAAMQRNDPPFKLDSLTATFSPAIVSLIQRCWDKNPALRPAMLEIRDRWKLQP